MARARTDPARRLAGTALLAGLLTLAAASPIEPNLLAGLTWRNIGPFRGGRISAVSGVVGESGIFYAGTPGGGVWKTTSAGATWFPVFDGVSIVSSIGAVAVAPSNPNVVYVGTGDMITGGMINEGNGIYKSTDAGKTWQHLGLAATQHIPSISVDPRDADVVLVAAQGDLHTQVRRARHLPQHRRRPHVDEDAVRRRSKTGVQNLASAYDAPDVVFATTVRITCRPAIRRRTPARARLRCADRHRPVQVHGRRRHLAGALRQRASRASRADHGGRGDEHRTRNACSSHRDRASIRSDDGGATWRQMAADDERIATAGGYKCGVWRRPEESRRRLHRSTPRATSRWTAARPSPASRARRRRRSAADVDRSDERPAHLPRPRSGRDHLARRRRHVELLVQPVDRADLPRRGRQLVPVLDLRDAAGRRRHPHAQPRQPRRGDDVRLERRERLGMGHDHARPAASATSSTRAATAS